VDLERVLGISAFDMDKLLQQDPHFLVRQQLQQQHCCWISSE
jgi:hypothetical protein